MEGMAYPFQITTGRVILRIVISSTHGGIIHNQNTRGCKSPVPSIFGNLFNLLSVFLCLCCFLQSGKTHILFTLFLLVILNSDLRRNISCTKIEKQSDRRGGTTVFKWEMVREMENTLFDSLPYQACIPNFPEVTWHLKLLFPHSSILQSFR